MWEKEKKRIAEIQRVDSIVDLDVSGAHMSVSKAMLCQIKGSALEAMFSGRHALEKRPNGRIFIGRNPEAFEMMVDYVRNFGQLHEKQRKYIRMLELELEFWGIDVNFVVEKDKICKKMSKCELI